MALVSFPVDVGSDDPIDTGHRPRLRLACVKAKPPVELLAGLSLLFEQRWALLGVFLGDLSSTMSLAPLERVTLEFQASQRRLLEQTTVDSAEELTSLESTTSDKEVLNAARSSTKTEGWHIDGSGSVSLGTVATLGVAGGAQGSVQDVAQNSLQRITEATRKSAHSLKTLHKIEVRGVTETFVQNRLTRTIKNPFPDRTLSLNVFQLVRHFGIETDLVEVRLLLTIRFGGFDFDAGFVIANSDFLQETLLDKAFIDDFPRAFAGARPLPAALARASDAAILALELLFDEPNVFNMAHVVTREFPPQDLGDPNPPPTSFDHGRFGPHSGLEDSIRNNLGALFATLNLFFAAYIKLKDGGALQTHAVIFATALADNLKPSWDAILAATDENTRKALQNVLDNGDFTEILRRLSGFLAMVAGMVEAGGQDGDAASREDDLFALDRLLAHLNCNSHFYSQQYLVHLARKTNNQAIVDFVEEVIDRGALSDQERTTIRTLFDVQAAFVDRQQILVPSVRALTEEEVNDFIRGLDEERVPPFHFDDVVPTVEPDLELPTDGIHLEVAEGRCRLAEVPASGQQEVELSVQGAQLKVDTSC